MKRKIVSHCWVESEYNMPPGQPDRRYKQLQVVSDDGALWILEKTWANGIVTERWVKVKVPELPGHDE